MTDDYIDAGDRVIVKSDGHPNGFGGQVLTAHKGKHGIVVSNDGFGRCAVLLDDGVTVDAWNGADLEREPQQ
jgi:hypothetical protein